MVWSCYQQGLMSRSVEHLIPLLTGMYYNCTAFTRNEVRIGSNYNIHVQVGGHRTIEVNAILLRVGLKLIIGP